MRRRQFILTGGSLLLGLACRRQYSFENPPPPDSSDLTATAIVAARPTSTPVSEQVEAPETIQFQGKTYTRSTKPLPENVRLSSAGRTQDGKYNVYLVLSTEPEVKGAIVIEVGPARQRVRYDPAG